jgi:photosystem II stability/assembly factor-like uncharacterized protein
MRKLSILFLFIFISGVSMAQWNWQNPLPQGNLLLQLQFTDPNTGYAIGYGPNIIKTTDAGEIWTLLPNGTTLNLFAIWFTGSTTGYAAGYYGTIFKTLDGGVTWTTQSCWTTNTLC